MTMDREAPEKKVRKNIYTTWILGGGPGSEVTAEAYLVFSKNLTQVKLLIDKLKDTVEIPVIKSDLYYFSTPESSDLDLSMHRYTGELLLNMNRGSITTRLAVVCSDDPPLI